jgi:hypothetical protein
VSPFAAGCAICGADLDVKRWDTGPSGVNRVGSWLSALSMGPSKAGPWTWFIVLLVLFFSGSIVSLIVYLLYSL